MRDRAVSGAREISVAFLRGVNVGGHRRLRMADLVQWLGAAGLSRVQTYIQSGNVVVEHAATLDVAPRIHEVIAEMTGWDVPVVVRGADELRAVVAANPFPDAAPTHLHVAFLPSAPEGAPDDLVNHAPWRPEEFRVIGRDVYLFVPPGIGHSVMVPRLSLLRAATTRNWNTVLAVVELARDASRRGAAMDEGGGD